MAIYCGWIFFEFCFIYFFYPETYNRTLEELAFLFEDKELANQAVVAVEKQIHQDVDHVEELGGGDKAVEIQATQLEDKEIGSSKV